MTITWSSDLGQKIVLKNKSLALLSHFSRKIFEKKSIYTPLKTKKGRFLGGFKSSFKVLFFKVIPATPPRHLKQWRFVNFKNAHPIFLIYHEKVPRLWYQKFWLLMWEKFQIFDNFQNKCRPQKQGCSISLKI